MGTHDEVLGEELFSKDMQQDYTGLLRTGIEEKEKEALRSCTKTGRPPGGDGFVKGMEEMLKRQLARRPRGRPTMESY